MERGSKPIAWGQPGCGLNAQGIVLGDRIRYTVYGGSGYAHDFQKLGK
jgi:hypothetical protein